MSSYACLPNISIFTAYVDGYSRFACPQTTRDEKDTAMREQHCRITLFCKWHDKVKSLVGFHSWFDYAETVPRLCITPFLTVEVVRFINVNC